MSVITAVRKQNMICIAADGQTNYGSTIAEGKHLKNHCKIYPVNESFVGMVGWGAVEMVFEHLSTEKPELFKLDSRLEIYGTLLKLHNILKEEYFVESNDDENDQPVESSQLRGLIVNKNGLFKFDTYREVDEFVDFWAIGSGYRFALGAMHSVYEKQYNAEEIALAGIEAAIEYNDGCGRPISKEIITLENLSK